MWLIVPAPPRPPPPRTRARPTFVSVLALVIFAPRCARWVGGWVGGWGALGRSGGGDGMLRAGLRLHILRLFHIHDEGKHNNFISCFS